MEKSNMTDQDAREFIKDYFDRMEQDIRELRGDISSLRTDFGNLRSEFNEFKGKYEGARETSRWMTGILLVAAGAISALVSVLMKSCGNPPA